MSANTSRVPGEYAQRRFEEGRSLWRRTIRLQLFLIAVPTSAFVLALAIWQGTQFSWWITGLTHGGLLAIVVWAWDSPPEYIASWRRGAEGERRTAKALRPLLREGWQVEHDVQLDRGNIDHVVDGPRCAFVLETKNFGGTTRVEGSVLTTQQALDPREIYRDYDLARRVLARAAGESVRRRSASGRSEWVHAAVVIWGDFPQRLVEAEKLTYLHGDELVAWLRRKGS
jgi:hypothetical protein